MYGNIAMTSHVHSFKTCTTSYQNMWSSYLAILNVQSTWCSDHLVVLFISCQFGTSTCYQGGSTEGARCVPEEERRPEFRSPELIQSGAAAYICDSSHSQQDVKRSRDG